MKKSGRIRAYAGFMAASFSVNVKSVLEYRVNFFIQFFGMMLNNAAFAVFWGLLIQKTGSVGGYGFSDVMMVWALASSSFGFAHIVLGNVRSLSHIVMTGGLDVYLLQPKDAFLNLLASRTIVSAWGDFVYGYIVLALLPFPTAEKFLLFTLLVLSGSLIFASVFSAAESLVFFMGNSSAVSSALSEFLLSFTLYPEGVFGNELRWALYSVVPAGFIAFLPLRVYTSLNWTLVPVLWGIAVFYAALAYVIFHRGLKRYESGNRMDARI